MAEYRVGLVGLGRRKNADGTTRLGMAYYHAYGYSQLDNCRIVACADIARDNAEAFAAEYDGAAVYLDYQEMLRQASLDIVSICTWPHLHAEMTIAAAAAGVKAIHCEKPVAATWDGARKMVQTCDSAGVQLTIDHQRRFGAPFRKTKELLDSGEIGHLRRMEASCPNLYDWGTHWFDMFFMFNNECAAKWIMGQIDCREEKSVFGVQLESQGISEILWTNGVRGIMFTGEDAEIGCAIRLVGDDGIIQIGVTGGPTLRVRQFGKGDWRTIETGEGLHDKEDWARAVADLVTCLESGAEPVLSGRKALQATEVIFATYESSRRRARVDLPLDVDGSPLAEMLASGEVKRKG